MPPPNSTMAPRPPMTPTRKIAIAIASVATATATVAVRAAKARKPLKFKSQTPVAIHVALAAWVALMLGLSFFAPIEYSSIVQEDRFIEWWTVTLFLAAAVALVLRGIARRSLFEFLVAAFCIFVAGEEFSWGQRLFGFTPPAIFLRHSTQQEFTVHNLATLFGHAQGLLTIL